MQESRAVSGGAEADYIAVNRELWNRDSDEYQRRHGGQLEKSGGLAWGVWQIPEAELHVLGDVKGRDVLELGCGAAQWSIALHQLGARVTGLDLSERQLAHARRLMDQADLGFPLVHAGAEATPFPDESFDIVFCDHGAMNFADPHRTVPEAARILRPGGLLAFSMGTPILDIAWAENEENPRAEFVRDYWGLYRILDDEGTINFQLPYGEWIRLFVENGLIVESLLELRPPEGATSSYRDETDLAWARRWPMEHIWRVRRAA